ncbi:MAG: competence protein ComK [Bacilli bacterium]|nr:competence protein ComK [Bacilli bacterium]
MLDNYEINPSTLMITPLSNSVSEVIEEDNKYLINKSANEIIDYSCRFFGSSYAGRYQGTKSVIGYNYKLPIIIDEIREIIFFPTCSPKYGKCHWISSKKINSIKKEDNKTTIIFKNGFSFSLDISYYSLENQIFRSSYLENKLRSRRIS